MYQSTLAGALGMNQPTVFRTGSRCIVIHEFDGNQSLEGGWNALWIRAKGHYHESYTVCAHAWREIARNAGDALFCVLVWEVERLVLAWPLVKYTRGPIRLIKPLTPSGGEANSILADPECDAVQWVNLAWKAVAERSNCDIFYLPLLRVGSLLDSAIPRSLIKSMEYDAAPYARLSLENDWESYCSAIGAGTWQQTARKRKRILQLEESQFIWFDPIEKPELSEELIDWMLAEKQEWAIRMQKQNTWVNSPHYRSFLVESITDRREKIKYALCAINVNKKPIAVKLLAICPGHIEYVIGAYSSNPELAKLSPGLVLDEFWMKRAFELRMDVDFGTGREAYKLFWSRGNLNELHTYRLPISMLGRFILTVLRIAPAPALRRSRR